MLNKHIAKCIITEFSIVLQNVLSFSRNFVISLLNPSTALVSHEWYHISFLIVRTLRRSFACIWISNYFSPSRLHFFPLLYTNHHSVCGCWNGVPGQPLLPSGILWTCLLREGEGSNSFGVSSFWRRRSCNPFFLFWASTTRQRRTSHSFWHDDLCRLGIRWGGDSQVRGHCQVFFLWFFHFIGAR